MNKHSVHIETAVTAMITAMMDPPATRPMGDETFGDCAKRLRSYCRGLLKKKDRDRLGNDQLVKDRVSDGLGIIEHLCEQRPDIAARWIAELVINGRCVRYDSLPDPDPDHFAYSHWMALDRSLERWAGLVAWNDEPAGSARARRSELERIIKMEAGK